MLALSTTNSTRTSINYAHCCIIMIVTILSQRTESKKGMFEG